MAKTIIDELDELKDEMQDCNKGKKRFVSEQDVLDAYSEYTETIDAMYQSQFMD